MNRLNSRLGPLALGLMLMGFSAVMPPSREWSRLVLVHAEPMPAFTDEPLSLPAAVQLAYRQHPELRKLRRDYARAAARLSQTGLLANPELQFIGEDFAGSAAFTDDRFTQFTLELAQQLPLGDRLGHARELARLSQQLLVWDYRLELLRVARDVALAYARIQALQARRELGLDLLTNARATAELIELRVEAGKQPPVAGFQAREAVQALEAEQAGLDSQMRLAKLQLAALWGGQPAPASLGLPVRPLAALPAIEALRPRLAQHPQIARWQPEQDYRRENRLDAQAQALPDLSLGGGLRYHPPLDWGLVVNLGLPLPLFNSNQGNIAEARLREETLAQEREQELRGLDSALDQAYEKYQGAFRQTLLYRNQLNLVTEVFRLDGITFREGKTDALALLRSQEKLFAVQRELLASQAAAAEARVELDYLIQNLESVPEVPITEPGG